MGSIIQAEDISSFRATRLTIAVAKKENVNHVKSRFLVASLQEEKFSKRFGKYVLIGNAVNDVTFEENVPGGEFTFELLKPFTSTVADAQGGYAVNLFELQKNKEVADQLVDILYRAGGMIRRYNFEKGPCYQNDLAGKRVERNGKPVVRNYVDVFCQASMIIDDGHGNAITQWAKDYSPEERGRRIEETFYKEPVSEVATPAAAEEKPAETPAEASSGAPF